MSLKDNEKMQQTLANKEAKNTTIRPWPDLPHQIASQLTLEQGINIGSVTKSWRATPKKCNPNAMLPWLQTSDTNTGISDQQQRDITDPWVAWRAPRFEFKCAALSSTCSCGRMVMILKGTSHPAFMFHRLERGGGYEGLKPDRSLIDPDAPGNAQKHYMQFTNAIGVRGEFYALTLAIPSVSTRHFREYLVESNGEILLNFLISKKSINVVDDVEVFGLDFVRLSRIKTESLGDQTLFVGDNCCVCLCDWWLYDMESGGISQGRSDTKSKTKSPVWNY
ncbi:hypothetical protein RGQ29_031445 [Quercus rubra]|uniref:KIB1-4 beta-propeller domain-containing protein n=1 Tax=Quercus rubra TaxID=3512 RepID=A0AAN7ELM5_QUERU|nr:hypothetical protein RGQ29_031445 [Quercus rubra]